MRAGLYALVKLEPGFVPVASAGSAAEALDRASSHGPNVALIDYHLGDMDGLELCRELRRMPDPPAVVLYSAFVDERLELAAWLAGVRTVVSKGGSTDVLFDAMRSAARGRHPGKAEPSLLSAASGLVALNDLPILGMLAEKTPISEIAEVLALSPREVESRVEGLVEQLKQEIGTPMLSSRSLIP